MSLSILFISATQAVGFSPRGKSGRLTVLPADASGDIGLSIEALLAAMPGRQKQVYVLTTEVWSQSVTVESRSLRRIDKSQIPQMLAFEAETFSGIPATSARTAIEQLDSGPLETSYWVSQIDSTRFAQAADAVAFNGGKLLGIAHPAGLPAPLIASSGDWTRLEQWGEATIVISRQGRGNVERRFVLEPAAPIDSPGAAHDFLTRSEVACRGRIEVLQQPALQQEALQQEMIAQQGTFVQPKTAVQHAAVGDAEGVVQLSRESDLQAFLAAWSRVLRKPKGLPVIRPVRQQASAQTKRTLALAATAAAIVGIAAHSRLSGIQNDSRVEQLQAEIVELQAPIDQFDGQRKELSELQTELESTQQNVKELQSLMVRYQGQLGIHRSRMATLLRALGENRPRDLMLSGVQSDGDSIRVTGRSVRPEAIMDFAAAMSKRLEVMNLSIRVPRREALLMTADGGPYEFEYVITDGA